MRYVSTRGYAGQSGEGATFAEVTLDGLAPDGGLYVPLAHPYFDTHTLDKFTRLSYQELAFEVMYPFVGEDLSAETLKKLIQKAYSTFDHAEVAPLSNLTENHHLLELYHGPTLAFKDVALQFLGLLLDELLEQRADGHAAQLTVLGATSGDTGPAAIEGLKGRDHVRIFMLYPHGRVSDFQRRQMTTVKASNVYPIAIEGTFDDCQHLVKGLFHDAGFRAEQKLTAINSISWARLLPQMVYYFYAYAQLQKRGLKSPPTFVVPTGNFGDIFAGYMAQKCGLPVAKFVIANNQNDILTRFVHHNDYSVAHVEPSQSPSIDISVASNFERYLFDILGQDHEQLRYFMQNFAEHKILPKLDGDKFMQVQQTFTAYAVTEDQTTATIARYHTDHNRLMDPHTAVGLFAADKYLADNPEANVVTLATAHAAKFPDAVYKATKVSPEVPQALKHVLVDEEKSAQLACDEITLKDYIRTP
tara:strand:- start:106365 stop:107786 length:1422 start_codon:yes stop_codon:yes gene_type:complete